MAEIPPKAPVVHIKPCSEYVADLNALEQAIVDICSPDMVREIQERKRMIQKK
jgi:hypothetical protein